MGQDAAAGAERLEPEPSEEAALGPFDVGSRDAIRLLVHVHARPGVLAERAIRAPGGERPGRPAVAVVRLVAELVGRQVETDDVARIAGDQLALLGRRDDVIRRADDRGEIADDIRLEPEASERADLGHGPPRGRRRRRRQSYDRPVGDDSGRIGSRDGQRAGRGRAGAGRSSISATSSPLDRSGPARCRIPAPGTAGDRSRVVVRGHPDGGTAERRTADGRDRHREQHAEDQQRLPRQLAVVEPANDAERLRRQPAARIDRLDDHVLRPRGEPRLDREPAIWPDGFERPAGDPDPGSRRGAPADRRRKGPRGGNQRRRQRRPGDRRRRVEVEVRHDDRRDVATGVDRERVDRPAPALGCRQGQARRAGS